MHISEGILSLPILIGGGATAIVGIAVGLKHIDNDRIIETSLLSSAFFVASLIHIPVGPGSVHLVLNGLVGLLLGWAAVPAIATALFLQALLFGFGGLTVLGVNTVTMAAPAVAVFYLFGPMIRKNGKTRLIGAFGAGVVAILLSTFLLALALAGTDPSFLKTAQLLFIAQLPLMLLEGLITLFVVSFIGKVQPDLLNFTCKAQQ